MTANPNFKIHYACVAKSTTILAEFNSKDADLGTLALKCLEKTPQYHSFFSHTQRFTTYMFLIENPFTYFAIFDSKIENFEGLSFLKSVRDAFNKMVANNSVKNGFGFNSHCFQGEFNPVFHQLMACFLEIEVPNSPRMGLNLDHNGGGGGESLDSNRGIKIGSFQLLGDGPKGLKKKKKRWFGGVSNGENCRDGDNLDVSYDDGSSSGGGGLSREFSVAMHKNVLFSGELGQNQKAKRVWKKQVWIVLSLDLVVCSILFVIWLCVCRGFKCING